MWFFFFVISVQYNVFVFFSHLFFNAYYSKKTMQTDLLTFAFIRSCISSCVKNEGNCSLKNFSQQKQLMHKANFVLVL